MGNGLAQDDQLHRKALKLAAVPVTLGVLASVVVALGGAYAWLDKRTRENWDTRFTAHIQVEDERYTHQHEDSQRIERKQDFMLDRMGIGLPPGVPRAEEVSVSTKHNDGGASATGGAQ